MPKDYETERVVWSSETGRQPDQEDDRKATMESEASQSVSAGTTTPTLERSIEHSFPDPHGRRDGPDPYLKPKALSALGRALAALARWILVIVLVLLAPIGLIAWSVAPRVTNPSQLADEVIESGLSEQIRVAMVDQISVNLADGEDSPVGADELRPVVENGFSQGWFNEQLIQLADEFEGWLSASGDGLPDLAIDLTPVKETLTADDQALSLIADRMDCTGPRCPSSELTLLNMLSEIPDEVDLLTIGAEPDTEPDPGILEARNQIQTIDRQIGLVPLVLVAALVAIALLARRDSRIRWLGSTLVVIAVPLFAVAMLLPGLASGWASGLLSDKIQISSANLEEVFSWVFGPAGSVARWMLLAGVTAVAISVALNIRRRRVSPR